MWALSKVNCGVHVEWDMDGHSCSIVMMFDCVVKNCGNLESFQQRVKIEVTKRSRDVVRM